MACSREIFDTYIMKELLACSHVSAQTRLPAPGEGCRDPAGSSEPPLLPQPFSKSATEHVQGHLVKRQVPPDLFQVRAEPVPHCLPAPVAQARACGRRPVAQSAIPTFLP